MRRDLTNWNLYPRITSSVYEPRNYQEVVEFISKNENVIARGAGKCYGDASFSKNIISSVRLTKIIEFNELSGVIRCESGVLLSSILELIVPKGYFLPVTPGTKFITIGGAFASDIHGKNHHIDGVFSDHVTEIKLVNYKGEIVCAKPNQELYIQSAGGLGLTGFIVEVCLQLKKIETAYIKQTSVKAKNLKEIFKLFEANNHCTYSVAWIDCLAVGKNIGRSILLLGEHATDKEVLSQRKKLAVHKSPFLNVPIYFPSFILNATFIRIFNFLYYKKSEGTNIVHYDPYFYPLDKINNWNRIYGKNGFVQYQFVLPKEQSYEGIQTILQVLSSNKLGSFLAVLKLFGKSHEDRYLHFPIEGYTLAVDIKITDSLWEILDQLDDIVNSYGGKVYLTKDARMSRSSFEKQYRNQFDVGDKFRSNLFLRLKNMYKQSLLIIGGNSDIAKATALQYLKCYKSGHVVLASRNIKALEEFVIENDIKNRTTILFYDVTDISSAANFVTSLPLKPKWILYAAGVLFDNDTCKVNPFAGAENINVNFLGATAIINQLVEDNNPNLERIIGISSIAGLRGRKSNYLYGAAKSGFHQYLFGLRQDLKERKIKVQAITPGVVNSKMTARIIKPRIAVNPDIVATSILKNSNSFEVYPSFIWFLIGKVVKYAPEFLIRKL